MGTSSPLDYYAAEGPSLPSLQDYYAAAMALFGIIIFAKFASHTRAPSPKGVHVICVGCAAIGAIACFWALGWISFDSKSPDGELVLRLVVAITAAISGGILAIEVGGHGSGWLKSLYGRWTRLWLQLRPRLKTKTPAGSNMTLDEALDIAGQLDQPRPNPTDVERAVVMLADQVKQHRGQPLAIIALVLILLLRRQSHRK
jgi:hypothetical protein